MSANPARTLLRAACSALACCPLLATSAVGLDRGSPPRFEHLSLRHGLSQSTVHAVIQDRRGFLWVGSDFGLNRYDGYGFTVFLHDTEDAASIGGNRIRALAEDAEGFLWVGTLESGLDRWDPATGRLFVTGKRWPRLYEIDVFP